MSVIDLGIIVLCTLGASLVMIFGEKSALHTFSSSVISAIYIYRCFNTRLLNFITKYCISYIIILTSGHVVPYYTIPIVFLLKYTIPTVRACTTVISVLVHSMSVDVEERGWEE